MTPGGAPAPAISCSRIGASPAPAAPASPAAIHPIAASYTDSSTPQSTAARIPGARWPHTAPAASWHPSFGLRAEAVFCDHRLQHLPVQTEIGDQPLQARVLILQRTQTLRFARVHAAELRLPRVNRCLTDAALSRHIIHRATGLHLLQRGDDLRLRSCRFPDGILAASLLLTQWRLGVSWSK
jgi:hypothetical protein